MRHSAFWWLVVVLVCGLLAGAALVAVGLSFTSSSGRSDIWIEVAKGGVQLGVVAVLGGVIATVLKTFDAYREDRRREREYRLGVFHDLLGAYKGLKAARRTLRAFGFRAPASGKLNGDQVAEYRTQLRSLIDIDLTLENIRRELESRPTLFNDSESLREDIETAGDYHHALIEEWESEGFSIQEGVEASRVNELVQLQYFLGEAEDENGFKTNVADPMWRMQTTIGPQV